MIHVADLPPGWLGKSHALHLGTRNLTSDYVLFIDSDVVLAPDALRRALGVAHERKWDALSVMPTLVAQGFWERTLLPLLAVSWSSVFLSSMTNDDKRRDIAVASGGFFLIRRDWYERAGTHAAVRDQIVEDVMFMRALKRAGARVRLQFGQSLARTRMHATLPQIFNGWARIFAGTSYRKPGPMLKVLAYTFICCLSVVPALVAGLFSTWFLVTALVHLLLMQSFAAKVYRATGHSGFNALLLPITTPMFIATLINAIRVCKSGAVQWRGTNVAVNER